MIRFLDKGAGLVFFPCVRQRQDVRNAAVVHDDGVVCKDHVCRFNRDTPAGCDQGVTMLHSRGSIRVVMASASKVLNSAERG